MKNSKKVSLIDTLKVGDKILVESKWFGTCEAVVSTSPSGGDTFVPSKKGTCVWASMPKGHGLFDCDSVLELLK